VKPLIVSEYVEPGTVQFIFRDYAFRNEQAVRAAEAASCAADQGVYWRYHDTLFLNQTGPTSFADDRLKQMAAELGLDTAAFNSCLDSGEKRADVEASLAEGRELGVDSTPTIFVNGIEVEDWHDFNAVSQAIESAAADG
jgi:protein-disulfide isomerase